MPIKTKYERTDQIMNEALERRSRKQQERQIQLEIDRMYPDGIDKSHLLSREFLLNYDITSTHSGIIEDLQMALTFSPEGSALETFTRKLLTDYFQAKHLC